MKFIDLGRQYNKIKKNLDSRLINIMENTSFIMGKDVETLESQLANYVGVKHCISCANGTDALQIPLMAWEIGPGDAVFLPSFTFYATAEVVSLVGATPIFIDVEEENFNIDVNKLEIAICNVLNENKLTPRVIIPVDLFGLPANYNEIEKIAKKYNLLVLEDGAQGFGGKINDKVACSFGNIASTSFFPAKPLGCYGDGGAIFTNDDNLNNIMRSIRNHGQGSDRYDNVRIGLNSRLDTIQAAVLIEKLSIFDDELVLRNKIAKKYNELLDGYIKTPRIYENCLSSWAQYTLIARDKDQRAKIQEYLKTLDIPTMIYYPIPLHKQTVYSDNYTRYCDLSVCENLSDCVFSIPMHPYLTDEEILFITDSIKKCL